MDENLDMPLEEQPKDRNRTMIIIGVVVLVLICCCCSIFAGFWLYNNGDQLLQQFSQALPLSTVLL